MAGSADDAARATANSADDVANIKFNFKSEDILDSHYNKHANEFGSISKKEYLLSANKLVTSSENNILTKVRSNGDKVFYRVDTNEFAAQTKEGVIRTYFKPVDGQSYFNK